MKYQRNPQTNLQIRIIKKKSLRGRKDFQCRYVYQYLILLSGIFGHFSKGGADRIYSRSGVCGAWMTFGSDERGSTLAGAKDGGKIDLSAPPAEPNVSERSDTENDR